jgi:hypothetical protein
VKPNINSVKVHPQLSYTKHLVDGLLVGDGSLWPRMCALPIVKHEAKVIKNLTKGG